MQLALTSQINKNGLVGLETTFFFQFAIQDKYVAFVCQNVFFPSLDTGIWREVTTGLIKNP